MSHCDSPSSQSCKTSCSVRKARSIARRDCRVSRLAPGRTRSSCAEAFSKVTRTPRTHQYNLGLVQLLLHLHNGVCLLRVLVLCQVLRQCRFEFTLLSRGQSAGVGLRWVDAKGVCTCRAERGGGTWRGQLVEEGRVLVENLGQEGECGSVRVFHVGNHDGWGVNERGKHSRMTHLRDPTLLVYLRSGRHAPCSCFPLPMMVDWPGYVQRQSNE